MTNANTPYSKTSTEALQLLADQYEDIIHSTSDECTHEAYGQIVTELLKRKK